MFNRKSKIIFVRHGSTIYTEQNRLYDAEDYPPLNESGREEMLKISAWVKNRNPKIDLIYTSSALRCIQSARILSKVYKQDFEVIDGLFERKTGIWSGLTYDQIEAKYPQMLEKFHSNPCNFVPEGGESIVDLNKRVSIVLDKIINENPNKRIIVITHMGVVQAAISNALTIAPRHQTKIYIPTASATQISYYKDWASLVYSGCLPD